MHTLLSPGIYSCLTLHSVACDPYIFLGAELQAARPVHPPHVRSGHLEDVQFQRLLHEDEVVVGHAEAVVVAGREQGAAGNRADHLHILQCRHILAFV